MGVPSWAAWIVWGVVAATLLRVGHSLPEEDLDQDTSQNRPKLLYILMDGFRWDYVEKQVPDALPGFNKFLKEGVRARWTNPIFPAVSFPSCITLSTGLYAESHNIIGNHFYDPVDKEGFDQYNSSSSVKAKWWTAEPIWTTAEKAGLRTAQFMWSRCDVPYDNRVTHHCEPYINERQHLDNFMKNIGKAIKKFDEGFDFVQVYTTQPDRKGHTHGPDSEQVKETMRDLDSAISFLMDELQQRNLADKVNIVIVSDHGMEYIGQGAIQRHEVDQYLDTSLVEKLSSSEGHMKVTVPEENIQQVFDQLSQIPWMSVYKKEDIPERLHFKNSKYAPDILVVAEEGHLLMPSYTAKQHPLRGIDTTKGTHGLSLDLPSMRGIFFAKGPAFHKGLVIDAIDLVDVYQVLAKVLQIAPQPHNGTWSHVEPALQSSSLQSPSEEANGSASLSLTSSVLSLCIFLLMRLF